MHRLFGENATTIKNIRIIKSKQKNKKIRYFVGSGFE